MTDYKGKEEQGKAKIGAWLAMLDLRKQDPTAENPLSLSLSPYLFFFFFFQHYYKQSITPFYPFFLFLTLVQEQLEILDSIVLVQKREMQRDGYLVFMITLALLFPIISPCSNGTCQFLDPCTNPTDCGPGLFCGNCPSSGKNQPSCTRYHATQVTSIINGLPFNKYTWLVTHNSFSIASEPSVNGVPRVTFYNQEDSVTNQLLNGVRGLMLDMYDFDGDIWLCHSFQGQCYNFTAFEPAINTLKEVEFFMSNNPSEIVTIIIEDYVHTPKGLTKLFTDAGLLKFWFPVSKMPANGGDWPTVTEMVTNNQRLLVFTSIASKETEEGIAYQWRYIAENEPGDDGVKQGSCSNRKESQPLNSRAVSMILQNYFPTIPDVSESCKEHSTGLVEMVNACYELAGNRMPTFLAVNFYMRSDGGGVFDTIDRMNGHNLCGCSTIIACQAGAPAGYCKNVPDIAQRTPQGNGDSSITNTGSTDLSGSPAPMPCFSGLLVSLSAILIMLT